MVNELSRRDEIGKGLGLFAMVMEESEKKGGRTTTRCPVLKTGGRGVTAKCRAASQP